MVRNDSESLSSSSSTSVSCHDSNDDTSKDTNQKRTISMHDLVVDVIMKTG